MNTSAAAPPCDLLVLGGGTAGIVAAKTAASLGASVLLVERDRPGGDCLWTGCVPSKALLAVGHAAAIARGSGHLGVVADGVRVDFATAMAHVQASIRTIAPIDSPEALAEAGVEVCLGQGRFVGPGLAEVDGQPVRFRQAIVATGAAPTVPAIPGLDQIDVLTSDDVWGLAEDPGHLVILGGGSIGCELGQGLARLGVRVTIVESAAGLLPQEDPAAAQIIAAQLVDDGVDVRLERRVVAVAGSGRAGELVFDDQERLAFDRLLVAVGRTARTQGIGLESVGVEVDERGLVVVDRALRTTNPRIWAAGDLTGHPAFTHVAGVHGSLAASNAVLGVRRKVDLSAIPRVTYTQPEVASVGTPTHHAERTVTHHHNHVDRAVTDDDTGGFSTLALDDKGRITGATVVGPRAGETLAELTLAVRQGLSTRDLAGVIHAYPTWNDGPWNAALADVREQLAKPLTRRALGAVVGTRRWWLERRDG